MSAWVSGERPHRGENLQEINRKRERGKDKTGYRYKIYKGVELLKFKVTKDEP